MKNHYLIRPAHFSHFSQEREMVARHFSREMRREKLREKWTKFWPSWSLIWPKIANFSSQSHLHSEIDCCNIYIFYFVQLLMTFIILAWNTFYRNYFRKMVNAIKSSKCYKVQWCIFLYTNRSDFALKITQTMVELGSK